MYFVWYHRIDLCWPWKEIRESFNGQFPNHLPPSFHALQCKFYRFIKDKKCPTMREQCHIYKGKSKYDVGIFGSDSSSPRYGVVKWANVWYPWMNENREEFLRKQMSSQSQNLA
jgi:hypothetical protein